MMKVLVADDSPTTRFALHKNLRQWGYEVVQAADGQEAWDALTEDDPPRIAILDWMMPELDGVEVCKRLQERENAPFVYTILLTSKSEKEDLVFALENGAHNFQSKPISPEELRSHVNVGKRLVEADDQLKEYAAQMEHLATTDSLTGVFNRRHFMQQGEKELYRAQRYERPLSVLLLDIDHFKRINDTFGHAAGDETLQAMADVCLGALRSNDVFGRLGGEEFGVVLTETDAETAFAVAERLRQTLADTVVVAAKRDRIGFTVSVGVAVLRPEDETIEELLSRADKGLYAAKEGGRNRVVQS